MNHTDLTETIEQSPYRVDQWVELLNFLDRKEDRLSKESVGIIIRGLRCLKRQIGEDDDVNPISLIRPTLAKLARSYNSPKLFKEAGKIYLQDFHLIDSAREHLSHAQTLGYQDSELPSLLEAAQTFSTLIAPSTGSGVTQRPYVNHPSAGTILRKTGRLSLVREPSTELSPAAVLPPQDLPKDPFDCLEKARNAAAISDWTNSQHFLSNVTVTDENKDLLWDTWTQIAEGLFGANRFKEAEAAYRAACLIDPHSLISQFNWGVGLQMIHRYQEALEAYRRADLLEPNHPKVWCNIGSVQFLMEDYREAEAALRKAVNLRKDYARAWDNLAAALGAQDKLEEAHIACNWALMYRSDFPEAQFKLGIIYFSQKNYEKALSRLALAVSHPSISSYTSAFISMTFSEMGSLVHAERALSLAAQWEVSIPEIVGMAWSTLGRARMKEMEYRKAILALEEACRLQPSNSQNWLDLGLAYQFEKEDIEASRCFSQVVQLDQARGIF